MMTESTPESLLAQAEEYEAKAAELRERAKAAAEWPKDGDPYWIVGGDGKVHENFWFFDAYDRGGRANLNIFRTRAEAELARDQTLVFRKLMRAAEKDARENPGVTPEWAVPSAASAETVLVQIWFRTQAARDAAEDEIGEEGLKLMRAKGGDD